MRGLLALIVFAFCVPSAQAATVSIERHPMPATKYGDSSYALLIVRAAPGETNDLAVSTRDAIVVRDGGAPLTVGAGCQAQAGGSVGCSSDLRVVGSIVDAGDGDDHISFDGRNGLLHGGPGNDVIESADTAGSTLAGDDGDDVLRGDGDLDGGPGADRLTAGAADDTLQGGAGRDVIDGGAGNDTVSFADHTAGVVVDLADPAPDGGDAVTGVENVVGGRGDDHISGDDEANRIDGGGGDDVLSGRGGDDVLDGAAGVDRVSGGDGNDTVDGEILDGGDGDDRLTAGRSARCGDGVDGVVAPAPRVLIRPDCERIYPARDDDLGDVDVDRPRLGRALSMTIHRAFTSRATRVHITVIAGGRTIGSHTSHLGAGRHRITIPLSRPAREVEIVFRTRDMKTGFRLRL